MWPATWSDDSELLERVLADAGYCGSWYTDQTGLVQHTKEIGSVLPLTRRQLAGPIPGTILLEMTVEDDRAWLREQWKRAQLPVVNHAVFEFRVNGRAGVRWLQAHCIFTPSEDGTCLYTRGLTFDVTESRARGGTVLRNPLAALARPLDGLVDALMTAVAAAEQAGLDSMAAKLRGFARTTGRMLAVSLMRELGVDDLVRFGPAVRLRDPAIKH